MRRNIHIVTWRGNNVLQIPSGALFRRGNEWMAFAIQDGKASQRKIEVDHNNGINAEVRSGIAEGDTVIIYPPDTIKDGSPVSKN